jgi:hypothetical protein
VLLHVIVCGGARGLRLEQRGQQRPPARPPARRQPGRGKGRRRSTKAKAPMVAAKDGRPPSHSHPWTTASLHGRAVWLGGNASIFIGFASIFCCQVRGGFRPSLPRSRVAIDTVIQRARLKGLKEKEKQLARVYLLKNPGGGGETCGPTMHPLPPWSGQSSGPSSPSSPIELDSFASPATPTTPRQDGPTPSDGSAAVVVRVTMPEDVGGSPTTLRGEADGSLSPQSAVLDPSRSRSPERKRAHSYGHYQRQLKSNAKVIGHQVTKGGKQGYSFVKTLATDFRDFINK